MFHAQVRVTNTIVEVKIATGPYHTANIHLTLLDGRNRMYPKEKVIYKRMLITTSTFIYLFIFLMVQTSHMQPYNFIRNVVWIKICRL